MEGGLDLNKPRTVWQIVGATLELYARFPVLFLALAVGVVAPYELIVLAATGYGPLREGSIPAGGELIVFLATVALVGPLVSALHVHAVRQVGDGETPRLGDVAIRGIRVLPVVAATAIMAALGEALGFIAFIVPGFILLLRWAVATQSAALDSGGWQDALRRSRELTRGNYARIIGLGFITGAVALVISSVANQAAHGHASSGSLVALGIVVRTLIQSFTALTFALLYFDLSARAQTTAAAPVREFERPRDLDP